MSTTLKRILKYTIIIVLVVITSIFSFASYTHYTSKFSGGGREGKMLDRVVLDFPFDSVLAKSDINNDGYQDLIVGKHSEELSRIEILINDSGIGFIPKTDDYFLDEVTAYSPLVRTGDFNLDGIDDFVIFDSGNGVGHEDNGGGFVGGVPSFLLSDESRQWHKSNALEDAVIEANNMCAPHCIAGQNILHLKHFTIGDVNNDGLLDIYVESGGGYRQPPAFFFYYKPDGTFEAKEGPDYLAERITRGITETDTWRYASGELIDIDNDGSLDLVMGRLARKNNHQDNMRNLVVFNDGEGHFLGENLVELAQPIWNDGWSYVKSMTFGDINGDSNLDILLIHNRETHTGRYIQILINTGYREYTDETENYLTNQAVTTAENCEKDVLNISAPSPVQLVDMDDDGDLDITFDGSNLLTKPCMPSSYEFSDNKFVPVDYSKWIDHPSKYVGTVISIFDINNDKFVDSIFLLSTNCSKKLPFGGDDEYCLDVVLKK